MEGIEIILEKDSNGKEIDLSNMSLETSKSVKEILESLINIAQSENDLKLSIGLEKGSAAHRICGSDKDMEVVCNKLQDVTSKSKSRKKEYVDNLNVIRNNIENYTSKISLYTYQDSTLMNKSIKTDLKPLFKDKFTSTKRSPEKNNFELKFFKGRVQDIGGKSPNFHLSNLNIPEETIHCSEKVAQSIAKLLYKDVNVSAWVQKRTGRSDLKNYCDIYISESEKYYSDFEDFFLKLPTLKGTESAHAISNKLQSYIDKKDYAGARKFIKCFLSDKAIPTYLMPILVICKGFRSDPYFTEILGKIEDLLKKEIGQVY